MTPTAMTYSVLPIIDMNFVIVFQVSVRPSSNDVLMPFSHFPYDSSGPLSRKPKPTTATKMRDGGKYGPHGHVAQRRGELRDGCGRRPSG